MELIKKILLLAGSTLFSLLLLEGGYRIFVGAKNSGTLQDQLALSQLTTDVSNQGVSLGGLIEPSSWRDVVYELKPNFSAIFQKKKVTTNSSHMREREFPPEKPVGTKRIIGLGDSIMFGWGVEQDETYLRVTEANLADQFPVQTLNFAVPGYNTAMEVGLFEHRAITFSPDLIVVQFVNNDFDVPAFMMQQEDPWDFSQSLLYTFIKERIQNAQKGKRNGLFAVQRARKKNREDQKTLAEYKWMTGAPGVTRAFERLRQLAPETPIIVITGTKTRTQEALLRRLSKQLQLKLVEVGPYVDRYLKEQNITADREMRKKLFTVAPNDRHPNALGHKIIAEALTDAVREVWAPRITQ